MGCQFFVFFFLLLIFSSLILYVCYIDFWHIHVSVPMCVLSYSHEEARRGCAVHLSVLLSFTPLTQDLQASQFS